MRKLRSFLTLVALVLLASGCASDSGPTTPTTPAGGNRTETEPNDFLGQALGALSSSDFVVTGSTTDFTDVDLYTVTASAPTARLVSLDWSTASDLELSISNSSGVFVRHVDTAGHPEACTLVGLPAGTYTVRVGSLTNAATPYALTIGQR